MSDFLQGFLKGAKETPRGYFAPLIALWRLFVTVTDSLVAGSDASKNQTTM